MLRKWYYPIYALPPNATHLIQPAGVSVFKPLKTEWKSTVHEWATQPENMCMATFCPVLKKKNERKFICNHQQWFFANVGYTRAIQTPWTIQNLFRITLKHNNSTNNLKSPGTKIKNRHLNTAIKIINQLSNELYNAGIDTETVVNVLNSAKNMRGIDSLNSTKN